MSFDNTMWSPAPVQLSSIPESSPLPTLQSSQRTVSHMTLSEYLCSGSEPARPSISRSPVTHLFHVSDTHESRVWAFRSSSIASVPQTATRSITKTARYLYRWHQTNLSEVVIANRAQYPEIIDMGGRVSCGASNVAHGSKRYYLI